MSTFSCRCSISPQISCRWIVALALGIVICSSASAQNDSASAKSIAANNSEGTFAIPKELDSFDSLMSFVEEIDRRQPNEASEEAMIAHQRKVARTVVVVARRAFELDLNERQAMQMAYFQLQAMKILVELGEPKIGKQFSAAVNTMRKDERREVAAVGMKFFVESGFDRWNAWSDAEKTNFVKQISIDLRRKEIHSESLQLLMDIVAFLGEVEGEPFAERLLADVLPRIEKAKDKRIQDGLQRLKGIRRRINLLGRKIKLHGELLDGTELDWESYRGKVVLVDFWATWCGPCRAEVPNVLRMYEAYHEKGFDVLGISLDSEASQAEAYIKQAGIPWATMFSHDPKRRGWEHPMAVHYGVTGIPRAILVDRNGKVLNMNARGGALVRELRRLLGEPLAEVPSHDESSAYRVAKPVVEP